MADDDLFRDDKKVRIITPYAKLRKLQGLSQEEAAERLCIPRRALIDIERGIRDPSKQTIRMMEQLYGCGGKLREYWWQKFSLSLVPPWWHKAIEKLRRWWHSNGADKSDV